MRILSFFMFIFWLGMVNFGLGGGDESGKWIITEIMMNPEDESMDEFVEIWFDAEETVDLSEFEVADKSETDRIVDFRGSFDVGNDGLLVSGPAVVLVVDGDYQGGYNHFLTDYEVDLSGVWMVTVDDGRIGNGLGNEIDQLQWIKSGEDLAKREWTKSDNGWSRQWIDDIEQDMNEDGRYTPGLVDSDSLAEFVKEPDMASVIFSEIYNEGEEKWRIELFNNGDEVDVAGWRLSVNDSEFWLDDLMGENDWLVEEIELGDFVSGEILMIDQYDRLVDEIEVPVVPAGKSWAKFIESWELTNRPTLGEMNIIWHEEDEVEEKIVEKNNPIEISEIEKCKIGELSKKNDGDDVLVEANLLVPVGWLDKNYLWAQDEEGGLKVKWSGDDLAVGDKILIEGKINDLKYQRVIQADKITRLGEGNITTYRISGDEISQYESNLVVVSGEVEKTNGSSIYLTNGEEETVRVYLKDGLEPDRKIKSGDRLEVIGIVDEVSSGYRLLPRSKEDIIWIEYDQMEKLPTVGPDWLRIIGFYG